MSALGSLSPFLQNENQRVSFTFLMSVWNQPVLELSASALDAPSINPRRNRIGRCSGTFSPRERG